jgi:ferredoxin-NADP reductase/predicted pyridoxine 5'-phosphate oxidase superfamily flavin-nucleotide-binding protein
MTTVTASPFHRGEQEIQTRLGVRDTIENVGQRFIRDHLPGEHQQFYEQLPMLMVGSVDDSGRPWASVLVGHPGFLKSPDPRTLDIHARPIFGDPLNGALETGAQLGILGIDLAARRRNRMNGSITSQEDGFFRVSVGQSFGNCPQYIQARDYEFLPGVAHIGEARTVHHLTSLDARAKDIIAAADSFYIATHLAGDKNDAANGTDVSHRGGKPGFVRIDDDKTLTFPDFSGNYHFNTMGNIQLNPRAGLLFIDFENGDVLYLTCSAEIIWDSEERRAFTGAERLVRFTLDEAILVEKAMPIRWDFVSYSPSLEQTGSWQEVEVKINETQRGNVYSNYTVVAVENENDVITSFYLEPEDGSKIPCHTAGQFLPIEIQPPGSMEPVRRTYTISNAPNGLYYRLSIKKEPAAMAHLPAGLASSYFHDHVQAGSTIRAMTPRGKFTLDETSTRPVVLLSGGVGATPMVSMLEKLTSCDGGCGSPRPVWYIHGAGNSHVHAFGQHVRNLAAEHPRVNVHVRYSRPADEDIEGNNYDSKGHIDIELLKTLLPFDDFEFYMCGPPAFLESVYQGLKDINVTDERIHYEFFGPGATLLKEQSGRPLVLPEDLEQRSPIPVRFAKSGIETSWDSSRGTLLDLAEAEGLRPAFSCRSGICQTCSAGVLKGEVDYVESPMASPEAGEALLCCSYPNLPPGEDEVVLDL